LVSLIRPHEAAVCSPASAALFSEKRFVSLAVICDHS
jgi:hypothetical protein